MKKQISEYIAQYLKYGMALAESHNKSLHIAKNLVKLSTIASKHIVESEIDWFSRIQAKKDAQTINKLSEELSGLLERYNELYQRIESTYDDLGHKLNRYYDIKPIQENKKCKPVQTRRVSWRKLITTE